MKIKKILLLLFITLICLLLSSHEVSVLLNNLFSIHRAIPITFLD